MRCLTILSFMNSFYADQGGDGSEAYPGNTEYNAGIHPGWPVHNNASHTSVCTFIYTHMGFIIATPRTGFCEGGISWRTEKIPKCL